MVRYPVQSSNLCSIGYDHSMMILECEFLGNSRRRNTVYQYFKVPASTYEGLMAAASHGTYLNQWVKPYFRYRQVA